MSDEEITFDASLPVKVAPDISDSKEKEIRAKAIEGIEKKQIIEQEQIKAGVKEPEKVDVPKELPFLMFHYGAKAISCPAFELDESEQKVMAKHLTILATRFIKATWMWSLIVIFIIILGKISQCWIAVSKLFSKKKKDEDKEKEKKEEEIKKVGEVIG